MEKLIIDNLYWFCRALFYNRGLSIIFLDVSTNLKTYLTLFANLHPSLIYALGPMSQFSPI